MEREDWCYIQRLLSNPLVEVMNQVMELFGDVQLSWSRLMLPATVEKLITLLSAESTPYN